MKKWLVAAKKADFQAIGEKFHIDPVVARLIRNREVIGEENIRIYLEGTLADLPDPLLMKDMERLVGLLLEKIASGKKIRVIGDYDVDGVVSTCLFLTALRRVGAVADAVIPNRIQDGYGLNLHLLQQAKDDGVDTILTCDNGIAALDEIAWAKAQGLTVLVTDHHAVPFTENDGVRTEKESAADAVVNPHQSACAYPYKELCGAGVAYEVIRVLYARARVPVSEADDLLELVAMATVCDVMSLTGANRILVREGLFRIQSPKNRGLAALIRACGLTGTIGAYHFGFVLGPCINATGRLDTAARALALLMAEDNETADRLAQELVQLNAERKELTRNGVEEGKRRCAEGGFENDPVLVVFLPDVHESIAGLIAGKLREVYDRPAFVLTRGEGCVKGSGRSTEAYSMYENMCKCADLFTKFGGHPMAAGLSLLEENVEAFRQRINACCPLSVEEIAPAVHIDMAMPADYATIELVQQFTRLLPFGKDNPAPLFADKNLAVSRMHVMGKNQNVLRLWVRTASGSGVNVIYFGDIAALDAYFSARFGECELQKAYRGQENAIRFAMTYVPKIDDFMGRVQLQLEMKDYR